MTPNDKDTDRTPAAEEEQADAASSAVIDAFLEQTQSEPLIEGKVEDWYEAPLPEGHRSGFVAVIGRPNVGKSTLVNALVGAKVAIVSPKPQTTRTRITGILTEPDYQLIFLDTPGIHKNPRHMLNERMIEQAVNTIPDADVLLFVVDVSVDPREEDALIARLLREKGREQPVLFVLNKMDRLAMEEAEDRIERYWELLPDYADSIPTSALKGTNLELLIDHLLPHVPEGPRYYPGGQVTDQTHYHIAAELIREAVLRYTRQEVPHAAATLVEDFEERDNGVVYIAARVWVERDAHKPIVIGKGGKRLKQIGIAARQELERFVGGKVYLDLWVKVQEDWRNREARLRELGY